MLGRFALYFSVRANSNPQVDPCPALLVVFFLSRVEKCAQTMLQFAGPVALEFWTLRLRARI